MATAMVEAIFKIDPNADTVIVLQNPNSPFADWDARVSIDAAAIGEATEDDDPSSEVIENEAYRNDAQPLVAEQPTIEDTINDEELPSSETDSIEPDTVENEMHFHVSSRHLILASPYFQRMLYEKAWKEGIPAKEDGLYHVLAEDWDSEAFLLLLNALHLRSKQVSRDISLEMLAKIAVLVDFYQCGEALELFIERWIAHVKVAFPIPSEPCRELMLWMCVATVFKLSHEFSQITAVAIKRHDQELPSLGLPIINCIDRIERARVEVIDATLLQLRNLVEEYRSAEYQCPNNSDKSFECGSILYGALTKEMELVGILPYPEAPFSGLDIWQLNDQMKRIRTPVWHEKEPYSYRSWDHPCDLGERVEAISNNVIGSVNGLKLESLEIS